MFDIRASVATAALAERAINTIPTRRTAQPLDAGVSLRAMASLDLRPPRGAVARPASSARSLLDVFDATLAAHAGHIALDAGTTRLTYAALAAAADDVARELRAAGVGCGDRVGVRIPSGTAELYVAILGVMRAGAAYVPVDADDPPARAAAILDAAAACAVLEDDLRLV